MDLTNENAEVYIFKIGPLLTPDDMQKQLEQLPLSEQNRINKYHHQADRQRSLVAQVFIRKKLKRALNCNLVNIKRSSNGRPYLCPSTHTFSGDFNLSHSEDKIICGFSSNGKIGVDIESIKPLDLSIIDFCFTQEERKYFNSLQDQERLLFFYKIWTLKEAYVKAIGTGITDSFSHFGFDMDMWRLGAVELKVHREDASGYHFKIIEHSNYLVAICSEQPYTKIRFIDDNPLNSIVDLS